MAKFHDSGTICKATKRPCPLGGDDAHIEADNMQDFENKLAEKMKVESETAKVKVNYDDLDTEELLHEATEAFGDDISEHGMIAVAYNDEAEPRSPEEKSAIAQAMIKKLKSHISEDDSDYIAHIFTAAHAEGSLNEKDLKDAAFALQALSEYGLETESWGDEIIIADLKEGGSLISYGGNDIENMQRYGTSATVKVSSFSENGKPTELEINVYDGDTLKTDELIGDSVTKLKRLGITGDVNIKINSKYGIEHIKAYDSENEDSDPDDGGRYGIEVGHYGLYAFATID